MSYSILIPEAIHEKGMTFLLEKGYEIKQGTSPLEDVVEKEICGCDAILVRNAVISEKVMRASGKLKVVAMHGVGVDRIDVDAATRLGIQVVNAKDSNKLAVAEFTIGLLIALSRKFLLYDKELRAGNWQIRRLMGTDLMDKTLGIIGMGAIGSLVAQKAVTGLSMNVIAYKRDIKDAVLMPGVTYTDNMEDVLTSADYLSLHIPYTSNTQKLIGRRELALLKPDAFLINTARGEVVDSEALYEVLRDKKIAGAAIDVFPGEVPDPSDPLLTLDNVILTPHAAAFTEQSLARMALYAASGIHEVLSGQLPTRPVNRLRQPVLV